MRAVSRLSRDGPRALRSAAMCGSCVRALQPSTTLQLSTHRDGGARAPAEGSGGDGGSAGRRDPRQGRGRLGWSTRGGMPAHPYATRQPRVLRTSGTRVCARARCVRRRASCTRNRMCSDTPPVRSFAALPFAPVKDWRMACRTRAGAQGVLAVVLNFRPLSPKRALSKSLRIVARQFRQLPPRKLTVRKHRLAFAALGIETIHLIKPFDIETSLAHTLRFSAFQM